MTQLAQGNDVDSFVYSIDVVEGGRYLLKLRAKRGFRGASIQVPAWLRDQEILQVVAPQRTADTSLFVDVGRFVLSLYPWIEAHTVAEAGLGLQSWRELGSLLRRIHLTSLPPEILEAVPRESFVPFRRQVLSDFVLKSKDPRSDSQLPSELADVLAPRLHIISTLLEYVDAKGEELRRRAPPQVLCHADLHGWNLLTDGHGKLWIVDWDEVVLAPKERDLMFLIEGIGHGLMEPEETDAVLAGYGHPVVDEELLTYYRCAWAVQDIAAYAEEITDCDFPAERADALGGLESLFAPGNIVEIAGLSLESARR